MDRGKPELGPGDFWNWKSAVLSASCRAPLFFVVTLSSGLSAATAAFVTELIYRGIAAGFYGALTERCARIRHRSLSIVTATILVPGVAHIFEYLVHRSAGTPRPGTAVLASVAMSLVTTQTSLFVMRRGWLLGGRGRRSLSSDLRQIGRLVAAAFRVSAASGGARRAEAP